jgi:glc operon protein GlcG
MLSWSTHAQAAQRHTRQEAAGARAMVDTCTAWAERNHVTVAMSVLDWAGNLIECHAMEGTAANAIDTALLKAKSALRWRRPTSEMNKIVRTGQNLAPTFMKDFPQPGALPIVVDGEVIGSMGVTTAKNAPKPRSTRCSTNKGPPRRKPSEFGPPWPRAGSFEGSSPNGRVPGSRLFRDLPGLGERSE